MPTTRTNRTRQKTTKSALNNKVQTKLQDLKTKPDEYIECRSYTYHAFNSNGLYYWRDETGHGIARLSTCTRCGMVREDYYQGKKRVYRSYFPPEGYGLQGSGDRVSTEDAVAELISRTTNIAPNRDSLPGVQRLLRVVGS